MGAVAARQHGVIALGQLRDLGLTKSAIATRVRRGTLLPLHRGVYAVGHTALPPFGQEAAAVLAVEEATLAEDSAAYLWDLGPRPPVVTLLTAHQRRPRAGMRIKRSALQQRERTRRHGLPVTMPIRTLSDLRRHPRFDAFVNEALVQRRVTVDELRRAGLFDEAPRMTRSEAERRLLALLRRAGLPLPLTNVEVLGTQVDAWWPERRLVLEVDGYAGHATRSRFERDRRNDLARHAAGITTIRISWRQLEEEPEKVLVALARALA